MFTSAVVRVVARAARLPKTGAPVPDTRAERDVRRFLVRRFPYSVVIARLAGEPAVIAVVHGHREFEYWRDRL